MKKKITSQQSHNKSLKTFYQYALLVLLLILGSLVVRVVFIWQQNLYNPGHHFTVAIVRQGLAKEIISFNPAIPSISVLKIQDAHVAYSTLAKQYGITADAYITSTENSLPSVSTLLGATAFHGNGVQTNMTFFDSIRLLLLAKNVTANNKITDTIKLAKSNSATNTVIARALTDPDISRESISIQIINATDVSGMGQRLGRVLTNMGANVVDVSTARETQQMTTIAYFGNESYTLQRLEKLLHVKASLLTKQQIANIVITIGENDRDTTTF